MGVTGSPATGKKTVANELGSLTGLKIVSLNDFAVRNRLGRRAGGEFVVDVRRLASKRIATKDTIIFGHLLPFVIPASKLDFVAILRCSPETLRRRYERRGYSIAKTAENVSAEILDIVSFSALQKYGRKKVAEFDTTRFRNPRNLARRILLTMDGKRPKDYGLCRWSGAAGKSELSLSRVTRGLADKEVHLNSEGK